MAGKQSETVISNGIDELSVVKDVERDTLKEIGIDVVGHQIKIMGQIRKLEHGKHDEVANEGGPTAFL